MFFKFKLFLAARIDNNPALKAVYFSLKYLIVPRRLEPPNNALYALDSQNPETVKALKLYCITVEKTLPKLKPAQFIEAINSVGFQAVINPASKDLAIPYKIAANNNIKTFFVDMIFAKPYDLPGNYLFGMMDRVEALGKAYVFPAYLYIFSVFQTYSEVGEARRHIQFLEKALRWFEDTQRSSPIPPKERLALFARAYSGSFGTSNDHNLKTIVQIERKLLKQYHDFILPGLPHDMPASQRPSAKIKIGLLRYDGRGEINFFKPLLSGLPANKYEIHVAMLNADGIEDLQERYPHVHFHILDRDLEKAIIAMHAIELDILINSTSLSGAFLHPVAALLNYRLAARQISYCADITTSGCDTMDYFLIGEKLGGGDLQGELVETVLPCPGVGFFIPPPVPQTHSRAAKRVALGIAGGDIVYASNAHMLKLTPDLLATWLAVLAGAQGTKLMLMPFSSELVTGRFGRSFLTMLWRLCAQHGIAQDRIILSHAQGRVETLADLQAADIFLDTFPYSGATSGAEALTAGLPIVTRTGPNMRARYLAAMLDELGLGDMVAEDTAAYSALAQKLAVSPAARQESSSRIKQSLAGASFFDADRIAGQLDVVLSGLFTKELEKDVV